MKNKKSIEKLCEEAGINRRTYYNRLTRGDKDLFAPTNRTKRTYMTEETRKLINENGITPYLYYERMRHGWSVFEASNTAPNAHVYKINGKSARSQLTVKRYAYMMQLIRDKRYSFEDAFNHVKKLDDIDKELNNGNTRRTA